MVVVASACGAGLLGLASAAHAAPVEKAAKAAEAEATPLASERASEQAMGLAREIIAIMFPPETRDDMILSLARTMAEQSSAGEIETIDDPSVRRIVEEHVGGMLERMQPILLSHIPEQMEAVAIAYAARFSIKELEEILAFARTPAGGHYFAASMDLMEDPAIAAVNRSLFLKIHEFIPAEQAALRDKIILYLEQQEALSNGDASAL